MGATRLDRGERYRSVRRILTVVAVLGVLVSIVAGTGQPLARAGAAQIGREEAPLPTAVEVHTRAEGVDLGVQVFAPEDPVEDAPGVVLLHGGGWSSGGAGDMAEWAGLLAEAGWVAFSLDYRLADDASPSWPGALDDVRSGIAWVQDNAERYGADPERTVVLAESAGAHLAALAAVDGATGDDLVAVALWSPPLRLDTLVPDPADGTVPGCGDTTACQEFWSMGWVTRFLGCHPGDCGERYAAANPIDQVHEDAPPVWVANGTRELVPLDQPQAFASALDAAGVDHALHAVEGPAHGHGYAHEVWNPMVAWLAEQLGVDVPEPVDFPGGPGPASTVVVTALVAFFGLAVLAVVLARRADDDAPTPAGDRAS